MSNFRGGSGPELFYSSSIAGTALSAFTTEASLMGLYPICSIPPTFFDKTGNESSSLKVRAYYVFGETSTAPTFAVGIRLTTTTTFALTNGWLSTTLTPVAVSLSTIHGQLDADITLRTLGATASTSTVTCDGVFSMSGNTTGAGISGSIPATGTADTFTTLDTIGDLPLYLWMTAACGTNNASNSAQLVTLKVYLEN